MCYITHVLSRSVSAVGILVASVGLSGCGPTEASETEVCRKAIELAGEEWSEDSGPFLACVGFLREQRLEMGTMEWRRFSRCVVEAETPVARAACPGAEEVEARFQARLGEVEADSCDSWFFPAYAGGRPLPPGDYEGRHGTRADCEAAQQAMQRNAAGMVRVGTCACVSTDAQ